MRQLTVRTATSMSRTKPALLMLASVSALFPFYGCYGFWLPTSSTKVSQIPNINGFSFPYGATLVQMRLQLTPDHDEFLDKEEENDDDCNIPFHDNAGISSKRSIEVESQVELPFSACIAYDAYADLPRQPTWSSWLDSVVISDQHPEESVWTLRFWGISYSWTAIAVKNDRPRLIQWQSTSGLQNFGTVRFHDRGNTKTLMTMKVTFVAPRAITFLFQKSNSLATYVEQKMITQSLYNFRDVVSEADLKERQTQDARL